jgi:LPPG:FO 2-phospho-L-lactate transferase
VILALAGGVGGAKLAQGLASVLPPSRLTNVVNTGDDFVHLGLSVCPDLDTVSYWLAGLNDRERGWGLAGETWHFMDSLKRLGGPEWFNLGDADLALHVLRTDMLRRGASLSEVTRTICARLGIAHLVAPMTDQTVQTRIHTANAELAFQDYFVRLRCEPEVKRVSFSGIEAAAPSPAFAAAMRNAVLQAVIICPSNPFLSVDPILAVPGVRKWLETTSVPVIAVSPIVGGQAIKGPAAKILHELGHESSVVSVADHYRDIIDGIVIDTVDQPALPALLDQQLEVLVTSTVMKNAQDQADLAGAVLKFAAEIRSR